MMRIGIVVGSTRPGRLGRDVGDWVYKTAINGGLAEYELVDLVEYELPLFDEDVVPMVTPGRKPHTKRWAEVVARLDGFVFVTPEYNHSIPAALKNAIDFLYAEWNNKAAGFVGYGADGAIRAIEHLRGVMGMVRMAPVGPQVTLNLTTDFKDYSEFAPQEGHADALAAMLTELVAWSGSLRHVRVGA